MAAASGTPAFRVARSPSTVSVCIGLVALATALAWYDPALLPMNAHMLVVAPLLVYAACRLALDQDEQQVQDSEDEIAGLPLVLVVSLGGIFLAFQWFDASRVNLLFRVYFCVMGTPAVAGVIALCCPWALWRPLSGKLLVDTHVKWVGHIKLTALNVVTLALAAPITGAFFVNQHWVLNNILAASFVLSALPKITIGKYQTGALLLAGLFVYDIVMVFFTPMMVEVATKLEGPIKLLLPRGTNDSTGKPAFGLLGLGDLVVPGIFMAQLMRRDALPFLKGVIAAAAAARKDAAPSQQAAGGRNKRGAAAGAGSSGDAADGGAESQQLVKAIEQEELPHAEFPLPLFHATWVAYVAGLLATILVMHVFHAAQPALLYLVPAVLLTSAGAAAVRGEFRALWGAHDGEYIDYMCDATGKPRPPPPVPKDAKKQADAAATAPTDAQS